MVVPPIYIYIWGRGDTTVVKNRLGVHVYCIVCCMYLIRSSVSLILFVYSFDFCLCFLFYSSFRSPFSYFLFIFHIAGLFIDGERCFVKTGSNDGVTLNLVYFYCTYMSSIVRVAWRMWMIMVEELKMISGRSFGWGKSEKKTATKSKEDDEEDDEMANQCAAANKGDHLKLAHSQAIREEEIFLRVMKRERACTKNKRVQFVMYFAIYCCYVIVLMRWHTCVCDACIYESFLFLPVNTEGCM